MKNIIPFVFVSLLGSVHATVTAADNDNAVSRGLVYIGDASESWMAKRGCVSCHQVPSMVWAHEAALRSRFQVSVEKLNEWETWSTNVVNFVKPDQKSDCDREATMASNIDTMAALLLAIPAKENALWRVEFAKKLASEQADDGSWHACGQLPMQRRPELETHATTTLWAILALTIEGAPFEQEAAVKFADRVATAESVEWYAARLLVADQLGDEQAEAFRNRLLKLQNEDGGWGWRAGEASDALGTGYALYALAKTDTHAKDLASARDYLTRTQTLSGTWTVQGTKKSAKGKPTATANDWGTAWAIIALAESRGSSHEAP